MKHWIRGKRAVLLSCALVAIAVALPRDQWIAKNSVEILTARWDGNLMGSVWTGVTQRADQLKEDTRSGWFFEAIRYPERPPISAEDYMLYDKSAKVTEARLSSEHVHIAFAVQMQPSVKSATSWLSPRVAFNIDQAIRLDGSNGYVHFLDALRWYALGSRDKAKAAMKKSIEAPGFDSYFGKATETAILGMEERTGYRGTLPRLEVLALSSRSIYGPPSEFGWFVAQTGTPEERALAIRLCSRFSGTDLLRNSAAASAMRYLASGSRASRASHLSEVVEQLHPRDAEQLGPEAVEILRSTAQEPDHVNELMARSPRNEPNLILELLQQACAIVFGATLLALVGVMAVREIDRKHLFAWVSATPHVLAAFGWIAAGRLLTPSGLRELEVLSLAHLALALQYGPRWLARLAPLGWVGLLLILKMPSSGIAMALLSLATIIAVAVQPNYSRSHWASLAGWGFALGSALLTVSSPMALIPTIAYGFGWSTVRYPWIRDRLGGVVYLLAALTCGTAITAVALGHHEAALLSWVLSAIGMTVFALLFQPLSKPGRSGGVVLCLALLLVWLTGVTLSQDAAGQRRVERILRDIGTR